jgi:hypothetical protein
MTKIAARGRETRPLSPAALAQSQAFWREKVPHKANQHHSSGDCAGEPPTTALFGGYLSTQSTAMTLAGMDQQFAYPIISHWEWLLKNADTDRHCEFQISPKGNHRQ